MRDFLIIFGVLGFLWLPAVLLFVGCGTDAKTKIGGSLVCLALWVLMAGGVLGNERNNQSKWNDGHCVCGQHWELDAVSVSRYGTETKYYTCSDCHTEIQIIH